MYFKISRLKTTCLLVLMCTLCSCKKQDNSRRHPEKNENNDNRGNYTWKEDIFNYESLPKMISNLNLNININKKAINDTFNVIIDQNLVGEIDLAKYEMTGKLEKVEDATIEFSGKEVLTTLQFDIELEKETFIKDLKANGSLKLDFVTKIDIDTSWNLVTDTELFDHSWLTKPKLDLGIVMIPFEKLASTIIKRIQEGVTEQIDRSLKTQFSLRETVMDMVRYIETPMIVDQESHVWMQIDPEKVFMTGVLNTEDWMQLRINAYGTTAFSTVKPDSIVPGFHLPSIQWASELLQNSQLSIYLNLEYEKLDRIVKSNFKGKRFAEGDKYIIIKDIALRKEGYKIAVDIDVSGSFDGTIVASGLPVYDSEKQMLLIDDLEISMRTKNVIKQAAVWIMKGKIKSKIEELTRFSMKDDLERLQRQINTQIEQINTQNQFELTLDINDLKIDQVILDQNRMYALINLGLFINLDIHNFKHSSANNASKFKEQIK